MLRTILIGLDGSDESRRAMELGIAWGKASGARVVGLRVVDEATAHGVDAGLALSVRARADSLIAAFTEQAAAAGITHEARILTGEPYEEIVAEAHRFDVVLLGKRPQFEYGWRHGSDSTLERVIQESSRPVVVVPSEADPNHMGPVVAAFDGGVHSSRAIYALAASGVARSRTVHVLTVDRERADAERTAMRAVEFLRSHELDARPAPFDGEFPALEAILGATLELSASLLVMGAYGHSQLRELLLGSTTRTMVTRSTVPVFCAR